MIIAPHEDQAARRGPLGVVPALLLQSVTGHPGPALKGDTGGPCVNVFQL